MCKFNMLSLLFVSYFWSNYDGPRTKVFIIKVKGEIKIWSYANEPPSCNIHAKISASWLAYSVSINPKEWTKMKSIVKDWNWLEQVEVSDQTIFPLQFGINKHS